MRRIASVSALAGLGLFGMAGACKSSATAPTPLTPDAYLKAYDSALCDFWVRCGFVPDAATCKATVATNPEMSQAVTSAIFGTLKLDPALGQTCLNTIKAAKCQTQLGSTLQPDIRTACEAAFTNKAATGSPCFMGVECQTGFCDTKLCAGQTCCVGSCSAVSTGIADGAACMPAELCVDGDYCDTGMKKCTKLVQPNGTCTQADACIPGYGCDSTGTKTCFKLASSGAQCNPMVASPCDEVNLYCDPMKMVCTKTPGAGQACLMNGTCGPGAACQGGATGMCVALPKTGDDCVNGVCVGSLKCDPTTKKCLPLATTLTCVSQAT
jgi:hypothetical protein